MSSKPRLAATQPMFSVLVPTYNQARYLPDAIESLIRQTCPDWEAIVVDDGSTDDTPRLAEAFAARDERIRVHHKPNGGVASALNEALDHAKGNWICWLSSDDSFEDDKLASHRETMESHPEVRFFHTHYSYFLEEGNVRHEPDLNRFDSDPAHDLQVVRYFYGNYVHGISVAIHREVFEHVGGFRVDLKNGQDYDMWLRASEHYRSHFVDRRTCVTRIHPGQGSSVFFEAGVFDCARAAVDFLNVHDFSRIFPRTNLETKEGIVRAVPHTLWVATNPKSIVAQCGVSAALVDRLREWISLDCPKSLRAWVGAQVRQATAPLATTLAGRRIVESLRAAAETDQPFRYRPHDALAQMTSFAAERGTGDAAHFRAALERYLAGIEN